MLPDTIRKTFQRSIWALAAEDHSAELITKALDCPRVLFISEALGERIKLLLFPLLGFESLFNELQQNSVSTELSILCDAGRLLSHVCGQAHALTHGLLCCPHTAILADVETVGSVRI